MSLNVFLELVEIKAKTASILPMLLGVCLSVYYYHSLNLLNSVLFFIAMLLFNMAVDMMDNYNDYNHAIDNVDYKYYWAGKYFTAFSSRPLACL